MPGRRVSPSRILPSRKPVVAAIAAIAIGTGLATATLGSESDDQRRLAAGYTTRSILSRPGDLAYGAYLGRDCRTCHHANSSQPNAAGPIEGLPYAYAVQALVEYRLDIRHNEVMRLVTARLSNEQIAALAAHFAAQRPEN